GPRRHSGGGGGGRNRARLVRCPVRTRENLSERPAATPRPSARREAVMRVASRSVWRRLSDRSRRLVLDDLLTIQLEVLHDQFRSHHPSPPQPASGDLRPPVLATASDQPPGESPTPV